MRRISTRLAVSFLIVALLPTLPLSLVVRNLLERRFGPAIADPLELALEAGLTESRAHLQELRLRLAEQAEQRAAGAGDSGIVLLDATGHVQAADSLAAYLKVRPELLARSRELSAPAVGQAVSVRRLDDTLAALVVRPQQTATVILQPLPPGMVQRAGDLTAGVSLLRVVRAEQGRVLLSFVGPFLLVYGVLIGVALVAGLLWSRQMVRPLEKLVSATRRVAHGDLEFRMEREGPGEVGELVHSFDNMVGRLAEQRRDLARLERAAAWRGMARTLAHEVKNPLTPILLAVHQVRDSYRGDDEKYRELLAEVAEIVGEEVDSLRSLVREFGDFARLPKPELQKGELAELLRDLEQLYGAEQLNLTGMEAAAGGWFDRGALRRALINLIDNGLTACRQADKPEQVELSVLAAEPGVKLVVRDRGVGIAAENLTRVFEPDFTTKSDGMGLGLAIVENIIIGHGGRIAVQSEPGRGTAFTIDLPLTAVVSAGQASQDGAS
jgi:nitrogen fixation/metabolism regulation signal transduction histidine kinase